MKVFYHNDQDGECAAFCVVYWGSSECDLIPMTYARKFPLSDIKEEEEVWIVDFSIDPEDMTDLLKKTSRVHWIDHHQTSIEKYKDYPQKINGVRYDGIAGCELTYMYIKASKDTQMTTKEVEDFPREKIPYYIRLVGDRDVWKFALGDDSGYFHMGANTYDTKPTAGFWEKLEIWEAATQKVIDRGKVATKYRDQFSARYLESYGFETKMAGHRAFAMNLSCSSEFFNSIDIKDYDMVISFAWNGETWKISMFTENEGIDVAAIAEKFGGGGHKKAAGCLVKELPFRKQ